MSSETVQERVDFRSGCEASVQWTGPAPLSLWIDGRHVVTDDPMACGLATAEKLTCGDPNLRAIALPRLRAANLFECRGLDSVDLPMATRVVASGAAALATLELPSARVLDLYDFRALTRVRAPHAELLQISWCGAIQVIDCDVETHVLRRGTTFPSALPERWWASRARCRAKILDRHLAFCVGIDSRGYEFWGDPDGGQWRVKAGCRNFWIKQARRHWADNPECLALVEQIAARVQR